MNTVAAVMPMPATSDHTAPPNRSHSGPQAARVIEPSSGPRKTYFSGSGAPSMPAYMFLMSRPSWAAKPENAPNVMR